MGLTFLNELPSITKQPVRVAWAATDDGHRAVEVYPAATLRAHDLLFTSYKKPEQSKQRAAILEGLGDLMAVRCEQDLLVTNADALDAAVCVLAGADFLQSPTIQPEDSDLAAKEGWIWVKKPERSR